MAVVVEDVFEGAVVEVVENVLEEAVKVVIDGLGPLNGQNLI